MLSVVPRPRSLPPQDPNGKRYTWQWVVLLPFIDEGRLVGAIDSVGATFSAEERRRNTLGSDLLFVHQQGGIAKYLLPLFKLPLPGAAPAAAAAAGAGAAKPADDVPAGAAEGIAASAAPTPAPAPAPAPAPGSIPVVSLKPHMGDANHKGLTAQCLRVSDAPAGQRGVTAPACPAGSLPSPWDPVLPPLSNLYVVTVAMCLPPRKAHVCSLLAGVEPTLPVLDPADDDPSSRIPRLTKGMCVADLAYALAAETNSAAYGASLQRGVAAMPVAAAMLGGGGGRGHYGGGGGGGGSYAGYGGSAAAGGYGAGAGGGHYGGYPPQQYQQPYPGHHGAAPPQHMQVGGYGQAYTAPGPGGFHGAPAGHHYPQQYQQQQPSAAQRTVLSSLGIRPAEGGAGAAAPGGYPPHPGYGGPATPPARPFSFGAGGGGGRGAPGPGHGGAYGAPPMMMTMGGAGGLLMAPGAGGGHPAAGGAGMGMGPAGGFAGPAGYGAAPPPYGAAPGFGAPRPGFPHHAPPPQQQPFSFARR